MNKKNLNGHRRLFALAMAVMMIMSLFALPAQAVQPSAYRDPAEHWMSAGSRTNLYGAE